MCSRKYVFIIRPVTKVSQISARKCTKGLKRLAAGLRPDPLGKLSGYSAPTDLPAGFKRGRDKRRRKGKTQEGVDN